MRIDDVPIKKICGNCRWWKNNGCGRPDYHMMKMMGFSMGVDKNSIKDCYEKCKQKNNKLLKKELIS